MNLRKIASELSKLAGVGESQKKYLDNEAKYLNKNIEEIDVTAPQVQEFIEKIKKESFIAQMNKFKCDFKKRHIMGGIALGVFILSIIYLIYISTVDSAFNMIGAIISATLPLVILIQGIPIYISSLKWVKKCRETYIKIESYGMFNYTQYLMLLEKVKEKETNNATNSN